MNKSSRHRRALRQLWSGACAVLLCGATAWGANAPEPRTHKFTMTGGALDEVLKQFSDQSGVSLVYDHRIVSGINAPAVSGALTTRDALGALLSESSLEYREIDSRTLAIIQRPVVIELMPELPPSDYKFEDDSTRRDEIIVTASYRAPGAHTGLRINYSLDAEVLNLSGAQSIAEPIHELPTTVASVSSANTQLLISAGGLNLTDLRGLEPTRSLVLINGRRFVRTSGGNGNIYGVDLNAIPTALIDRVEVINQGAGPSLGTDAVAGAVNIVMRDHIDGVSLGAHGGLSERGDAGEYSLSLFAGDEFAGGRGKFSGGVVYAMDPSLFFADRDYLSQPLGFALNGRQSTPTEGVFTPGFGGSIFTPNGFIAGAIDTSGDTTLIFDANEQPRLTPGGFEAFEGRLDQLYNWVTGFSALPEIDRLHGYARADYELSPTISFFGEFFFADVETITQVAAAPVSNFRGGNPAYGDSIVVPADHPDAPAGLRATIESTVGGPIESFLINRRFVELGPRRREIDRRTLDVHVGSVLDLGDDWSLNASYGFSRSRTRDRDLNKIDSARVSTAVDPTQCATTPDCIPFNIFSAGSVSAAAADFYRSPPRIRRITTTEHVARLTASGPIYELDDREGRISAGIEYRRDILDDEGISEPFAGAALASFEAPGANGSVGYSEIFAGADLPISPDYSALGVVELGADARVTRWSGGGFVANLSGDLSWTPAEGLEIYAFALYGGRAPNVVELHSAGLNSATLYFDPCDAPFNQTIADNCADAGPLGVPAGFTQADLLVHKSGTGNPNLDHEKVRARHFGVAADIQEFVYMGDDALRLTADWRFHRITNRIGGVDGIFALNTCYASQNLSDRFCRANPATGNLFFQRDAATGQLALVEETYLNGGEVRTSGLDATVAYRSDLLWAPFAPALSLDLLYSYAHRMKFRGVQGDVLIDEIGFANFPRHQVYATGSLETDRWKTLWTVRRRGATQTLKVNVPEATLPATTYVDASIQFRPNDNVIVYAGAENIFDKDLPIAAFAERGFFAEFFNPIGRRYFAGVKAEF